MYVCVLACSYICVCAYVRTCTCVRKGVRKLTCPVITEISWTDSSADEWLPINRLLFSLNSCLSTSLIKNRRCGEKIKPANGNRFQLISPSALKMSAPWRLWRFPARRGSSSSTHAGAGLWATSRLCKLDFGREFVNQEQPSWIYCCCWLIPVIQCTGVPAKLLQRLLCGGK